MKVDKASSSLRPLAWALCALMLSVPSASADEEAVVVAPKDESCPWVSIGLDDEPLFIRFQTNPACLPASLPSPGSPGPAVGVSVA